MNNANCYELLAILESMRHQRLGIEPCGTSWPINFQQCGEVCGMLCRLDGNLIFQRDVSDLQKKYQKEKDEKKYLQHVDPDHELKKNV